MTPRSVHTKVNISVALIALTPFLSSSFMFVGIHILAAFTNHFV